MSLTFSSFEQHIISGNMGGDPEVRQTKSGTSVCNISIAIKKRWKDKDEEWQEETVWRKIVAWGKDAEFLEKFCQKGTNVTIICDDFDANAYENKDKDLKADVSFVARQIIVNGNGKKKDDDDRGGRGGRSESRGGGSSDRRDSGRRGGSSRDESGDGGDSGRSSRGSSGRGSSKKEDDDIPF